ncbi:peptidase C13 family protein [Artemisia annua]|uniref:Peptidase C13 family protein n=1 Tax=Artemisia annua TaxID=35608 RepID=A0A2U1ND85_ARTAN|nr:peptidase C13 family protein [Artemisia annua]
MKGVSGMWHGDYVVIFVEIGALGIITLSDVAQTFDLLKAGGLKEENIVSFLYNKVEHHKDNPFLGKLRPGGQAKNYYAGLRKDYTGDDVTSMNILSVLSRKRSEVGYRKVISSNPRDMIFVVISAHGSAGIVINPNTELKKRGLMEAILSLQRGRKFGSLIGKALAKPVEGYIIGGDGAEVSRFSIAGEFGVMSVKKDKLENFQGYDQEWPFHNDY